MKISEKRESRIQNDLSRSSAVTVDGGLLYLTFRYFRYVEGSNHLTGDCEIEYLEKPWRYYVPTIIWDLFGPRRVVIVLPNPVCWDNDDDPIPQEKLQNILDNIEAALRKKRRRYKIISPDREAPLRSG